MRVGILARSSIITWAMTCAFASVALVGGVLALTACGMRHGTAPAGASPTVSISISASAGTVSAPPGRTVTISPSSPASASPRRIVVGRSGMVTLTQSDNGATVVLAPGQRIIVVLGGPGLPTWDQPLAAGPSADLLRRVSASGGYPSSAPARARFLAIRTGTTLIRSITDAACLHAKPRCEIAQQVWQVSVIITA